VRDDREPVGQPPVYLVGDVLGLVSADLVIEGLIAPASRFAAPATMTVPRVDIRPPMAACVPPGHCAVAPAVFPCPHKTRQT
jgi:hypothetical protein